jgi:hypothetical protein
MTVGNCGCKLCGLRGYSKNVTCRSVFPRFPDKPILLESYESQISAREVGGRMFFASRQQDWTTEPPTPKSLAETLIDFLNSPDAQPEHLKILLCAHEWVQDPGTATV